MYLTTYLRTLSVLRYKQLLQWLPLRQTQDYTSFVVLCHPRSGSTLLHTYLNSHPAVISKGEEVISDLRQYPERIDINYLQQQVFHPQPMPVKAVGIKLFVNFVAQPKAKILIDQLNELPKLKVILLKRKNPLRIILSNKIAEKTGQMSAWIKAQDLAIEDRRIHLPPGECLALLDQMESEFIQAEQSLPRPERLTIYYEDLVSQREVTPGQIQHFLQVPHRHLFSLLRQQNPETFYELISNYEELSDSLKGSRWGHLLDEE